MSAFGSFNQTYSIPYDQRFVGQQSSFLPFYSAQLYYQTSYVNDAYPKFSYNQLAQYGMNSASFMYPIDRQYQYQQRWNYLNEMQKNYWKQKIDAMALSMYARPFPMSYTTATVYPFQIKNQFITYPHFHGFDMRHSNPQRALHYGRPSNLVYNNWGAINAGNIRHLPPKMRIVFIPSGSIAVNQPCAGPLGMPPFLFNRMIQPDCSLPLPPPLPQIASLCLENDAQQILIQRYANPVAVFPFTPNWQIPQPIIPSYPQIPQLQQPASIPNIVPIFPSQTPLLLNAVSQPPQIPQCHNSGHPTPHCVCMPQPALSNNSSEQYGSASSYISAPTTNSNFQLIDGRITPLLGHPTLQSTKLNQAQQQYQNSHVNASISTDFGLHKTPPLPLGAIVVIDEYINKSVSSQELHNSKKHQKRTQHVNKPVRRSIMINPNTTNWIQSRKNQQLNEITPIEDDTRSRPSLINSKSAASSRSLFSLSINESVKPKKTITSSTEKSEQLPADTNNHLNSNKEKLNSSSTSDELRDLRLSLAMRDNELDQPPSIPDNNSIKEENQKLEEKSNASIRAPSSLLSKSKNTKTESIIEYKNSRKSPSTIRTSSRNTLASAKDTTIDSISLTTVSEADKRSERNISSTDTF